MLDVGGDIVQRTDSNLITTDSDGVGITERGEEEGRGKDAPGEHCDFVGERDQRVHWLEKKVAHAPNLQS